MFVLIVSRCGKIDLVTQILAHRGASVAEQENTIAAFSRAVSMGADAIELDVRATADNVLVVHHDPLLADGTVLSATAAAELPGWLPTLDAALRACDGVAVNVEIKHDPAVVDEAVHDAHVDAVIDALRTFDGGEPTRRWLISSFRFATVERVARLVSGPRTALLVEAIDRSAIDLAADSGFDGINPEDAHVTLDLVRAAHLAGLQVAVWTVDDPDRMATLFSWGVDAIFTNVPDIAIERRRCPTLENREIRG